MAKKHIITIAGKLGSGKSSTAKLISQTLGYKHYSTGDFMRKIAEEKNMSLFELSKLAEVDTSIDLSLDDRNKEIGKMNDIVLDSRLGFYFIPESFKVFFELDPETAAERIFKDREINPDRNNEDKAFDSKEKIIEKINNRLESERKRYKDIYNISDHTDHKNFDLVINTKDSSMEKVSQKVIEEYKKWLQE